MNSLNLTHSTPHTLTIPHHACEISPCCQCVKCLHSSSLFEKHLSFVRSLLY